MSMKKQEVSDFDYFKFHLPEFLEEHRGEFVLIKNETVHGFYPSQEEALAQGYKEFGNTEFLIQEVTDEKRAHYVNSFSIY